MSWIAGNKHLYFFIFSVLKHQQFPSGPTVWQEYHPMVHFKHIFFKENGGQKL